MKYLVVFEKSADGYGAFVPDLPGCIAVGKDRRTVQRLVREAIQLHVQDMRERGYAIPKPRATATEIELQEA